MVEVIIANITWGESRAVINVLTLYLHSVILRGVIFIETPAEITFADCMAIARKRGEICIGIKVEALELDASCNYGVDLIPEKNTRFALQPADCLVVLAEDEF